MNQDQKRQRVAFWAALAASLAPACMLYPSGGAKITRVDLPTSSARDSMRKDWVRIGEDFGRVIAAEEAAFNGRR